MASIDDIDKILRIGGRQQAKARQGSIQWFLRTVRQLRKEEEKATGVKGPKSQTGIEVKGPELQGQMVSFGYDPKLKDVLPYYDRYPLIVPLSVDGNSILGLNLHYLPPRVRLGFVRALQALAVEKNGTRRLKISYAIVKNATYLGNYAPCLKRYLFGHVRSKIVRVDAREWEQAVLLPLARFVGATESQVWKDSMSGRRPKRRRK